MYRVSLFAHTLSVTSGCVERKKDFQAQLCRYSYKKYIILILVIYQRSHLVNKIVQSALKKIHSYNMYSDFHNQKTIQCYIFASHIQYDTGST